MSHNEKTVLIVEDEAALLRALSEKFTSEGFSVLTAKNGEEGLEMALSKHPDMVLLDIIMPKMDGMTMLSKLREDAWGKFSKVIMLTNLSDMSSVEDSLSRGAFDYLVKTDWTLEDVVEKVRQRIGGE